MPACTSSDSAVLQVDSRWVFEFSTTASAFSRSAASSTYTWQLPTPVSITGTVDSSTTVLISDAPPRGISTSTRPRARISSLTESRVLASSSWIEPAGRPAVRDRLAQHRDDRRVRAHRRAGPAQQHRVAGLQADAGGVRGHVRPALVDDADHAERHPDLPQLQAVGQGGAADHVADRVGQEGQLPQAFGHRDDPHLGQRQPVDHRLGGAGGTRVLHVHGVRRDDVGRPLLQALGTSAAAPRPFPPGSRRPGRSRRSAPRWPAAEHSSSTPQSKTRSSRWTTSRSYPGPSAAASSGVDRPSNAGSSTAS